MKSHRTNANNNGHHSGAKYSTSSCQITIKILGVSRNELSCSNIDRFVKIVDYTQEFFFDKILNELY
jgi:hypothetical protein